MPAVFSRRAGGKNLYFGGGHSEIGDFSIYGYIFIILLTIFLKIGTQPFLGVFCYWVTSKYSARRFFLPHGGKNLYFSDFEGEI